MTTIDPPTPPRGKAVRRVFMAILAVLLVVLAFAGLWRYSNLRTAQVIGEIVARVETKKPLIALTFDDGPSREHTNAVLDLLAARDVRGTFFVTGKEVAANPEAARAIVAGGHALANHSYSHPRMMFMSAGAIAREIEATDAAIRAAGYDGEIAFRPPHGKKLLMLPIYLWRHERTTVTWDIEPESDAQIAADPSRIARHVIETAKPGSIVLLHVMYDSREASRRALPLIIDGLRQKGFTLVTVPELLAEHRRGAEAAGD